MAQTTANFGFNIAEGADVVNLLTQCYPNFTSLDSILQAIKETGVTTATTTKVGTVFQVVRTDSDCNMFRFIATANYASGDTFTVDGVAVTTTAMDGTALPAGAFVINQSVVGILNSGVLTIVGVVGASSVAAEDVTYDNTGTGLTATDVQAAIDEVVGDIPTGFAASAISYDNSGSGLSAADVQDAIDELAASGSGESYVTAETAVGEWIDGSTVYRKVYHATGTFTSEQVLDASVNTSNAKIIKFEGSFKSNNEWTPFIDAVLVGGTRYRSIPYLTTAGIKLVIAQYTVQEYNLIVYYIKTA